MTTKKKKKMMMNTKKIPATKRKTETNTKRVIIPEADQSVLDP